MSRIKFFDALFCGFSHRSQDLGFSGFGKKIGRLVNALAKLETIIKPANRESDMPYNTGEELLTSEEEQICSSGLSLWLPDTYPSPSSRRRCV